MIHQKMGDRWIVAKEVLKPSRTTLDIRSKVGRNDDLHELLAPVIGPLGLDVER
jgi:hypothetical protein